MSSGRTLPSYKTADKHLKAILKIIQEKDDVRCIADIPLYYPLSRQRIYDLGVDRVDAIKEACNFNKRKKKHSMLSKWADSENPTLQIAAFRLMADEDEYDRLTQSKIEAKVGNIGKEPFRIVTSEDAAGEISRLQED